MTKVKYEFKELNTSQKDKEFEKTKEEILSKISKISALKEYKKVLKEAKKMRTKLSQ